MFVLQILLLISNNYYLQRLIVSEAKVINIKELQFEDKKHTFS